MKLYAPLSTLVITLLALPGMALAEKAESPLKLAMQHCLGAFERLNPVDTSEMTATEAPDWTLAEAGGESFEVGPEVYMTVKGDIETELASCTIAAKADNLAEGFLGWATEAALIGIYGPVEGEDLTHLESIDWREPRMQVQIIEDNGITWIKAFEVEKEA